MKSKTNLPKRIAVIHLPPLPGSPLVSHISASEALSKAGLWAIQEAKAFAKAGFDGVIIENFGDVPFYKDSVPPETIAAMTVIAAAIREVTKAKLGINILRNDARSALAIAAVTGADFIRVNILNGVSATDQGWIEGQATFLLRERARLNAQNVAILADVHVKHAKSFSSDSIELSIEEAVGRAFASGVIITGPTTGRSPDLGALAAAGNAAKHLGVPLFIGSGTTAENVSELRKASGLGQDLGFIVGSALRKSGRPGANLDSKRILRLKTALKKPLKSKK